MCGFGISSRTGEQSKGIWNQEKAVLVWYTERRNFVNVRAVPVWVGVKFAWFEVSKPNVKFILCLRIVIAKSVSENKSSYPEASCVHVYI